MPIRNDNIDLLLLVAGEYATNDEEHFESYLFINGTTLYTNDSYFDTNGWIDPGTWYQKTLITQYCQLELPTWVVLPVTQLLLHWTERSVLNSHI